MNSTRRWNVIALGGLVGILVGLAFAWLWAPGAAAGRARGGAGHGVSTLGPGDAPGDGTPKLGERAQALSRIIEIRLRSNEFDKALALLQQANLLSSGECDQLYQEAADAVLSPSSPGGIHSKDYVQQNGGKQSVLTKLHQLNKITRQMPDSPVKVTLLLRMRLVHEMLAAGEPSPTITVDLPGPEALMDEATRITRNLPDEAGAASPWRLGGLSTLLFGAIGVVLTWMGQEFVKTVAQEIAKEYATGRFKSILDGSKPEASTFTGLRVPPATAPIADAHAGATSVAAGSGTIH